MDHIPEHIESLSELIQYLDDISGAFQPIELASALTLLLNAHPDAEAKAGHAWYDELAASSMILLDGDENVPWGLDYGPIMQGETPAGELLTHPNLERLDLQTLAYWQRRARESSNSVLLARYADLAWVFAKHLGGRQSIEDARLAIKGYLSSLSTLPISLDVDAIQNAQRAMSLALSINDRDLAIQIKGEMFALAQKLGSVSSLLGGAFLLEGFGLGPFVSVPLTDAERTNMLRPLEERLERERSTPNPASPISIWEAQNATELLSAYYLKTNQPTEVTRVLAAFGEVVHGRADQAEPMVGQAWLESYARLCREHGHKEFAIEATRALQALGPKVLEGLTRFSHEAQVSKEEMDRFIHQFVQGDFAEALGRVAVNMVPNWDHVYRPGIPLDTQLGTIP